MKFRINDVVVVTTGSSRGMTGTITKFSKDEQYITVEGVNKRTKHVKARNGQPGQRLEFFAPVHISNVAAVDPKTNKPTRIGYKKDAGQKVRIAKASGEILPKNLAKKAAPKKAAKKETKKTTKKKGDVEVIKA